jgi:hypothetical protein
VGKGHQEADRDADHKDADTSREIAPDAICNGFDRGFSNLDRGDAHEPDGLKSLGHILDDDAAAIAEQNVGSYRLAASTRGTRAVLLNTQKCLRICADLSLLDPPPAVTPLLPGARWAAGTFAALCSLDAVDPVEEANATMATLYATP